MSGCQRLPIPQTYCTTNNHVPAPTAHSPSAWPPPIKRVRSRLPPSVRAQPAGRPYLARAAARVASSSSWVSPILTSSPRGAVGIGTCAAAAASSATTTALAPRAGVWFGIPLANAGGDSFAPLSQVPHYSPPTSLDAVATPIRWRATSRIYTSFCNSPKRRFACAPCSC